MKYTEFKGNNPFGSQAKMLHHVDRLHEYKSTGDTHPFFMEINLTSNCNLRCKWCISENFTTNESIDTEHLKKFLKEYKDAGGLSITYSGGGEPTQHKDFEEIVIYTKSIGLEIGLMTNGVYNSNYNKLIGNNFRWIRLSVDTFIKEHYKEWKGLDAVNIVMRNIEELKKYPVKVGMNCNVSESHTIEDVQSLTNEMPNLADYLQFRPVLPRYFKEESIEVNDTVWKWLKDNFSNCDYINMSDDKLNDITNKNLFPFTSCEGHFFNPILDSNGDLSVCMYHPKDERFVFGNIYENSFEEIWKSDRRKKVIEFVRGLDYSKNCQVCCKLTEINKLIDYMNHPNVKDDINFV